MTLADKNERARQYRNRADELRAIADSLHGDCREKLLRTAEDYDRMAFNIEQIAPTRAF